MELSRSDRLAARRDLAAGLALFAASAVAGISLQTNEAVGLAAAAGRDPGPAFLPWILIALLAAGSVALALRAALKLAATGDAAPSPDAARWRQLGVPASMIATLAGYVLALDAVGFVASTAAFTALWSVLLGWQENGRPGPAALLRYLAEAAAITALVWFVFAEIIKVPLP